MRENELLFFEGELSAALEQQARKLEREVEQAPEEHLLNVDVQEWVSALVDRWRVEPPVLHPEQWSMDAEEAKVDVSWDYGRRDIRDPSRPAYVPGHRVVVHIPFSGDAGVFSLQPSTRTYNPPRATIHNGEVLTVIEYPADSPVDVRAKAEKLISDIEQYLGWARSDIEGFNRGLEQRARARIQARRDRVRKNYERLAETGIPLRGKVSSPKTYIADALVRRPAPEEDRRHVILTALNSHYRGKATAEAFNVAGKTDILVRHEERNLFIAECKVWSGAQAFSEAIDQLFRYAAWRDTKLAVVVFVSEKDLTSIVEKARDTLEAHPQFVEWREGANETELRALMTWPGDDRRHADLNVFVIHTPS
jgi:hypothetical protein